MTLTVDKNLELMLSNSFGGMRYLLGSESIGGNAGRWNCLPCYAANFYYNKNTGEIKYFGNIPREIPNNYSEGFFRLVVDFKISLAMQGDFRLDLIVNQSLESKTSEQARKVIEETVKQYNEKYGLKVEEIK